MQEEKAQPGKTSASIADRLPASDELGMKKELRYARVRANERRKSKEKGSYLRMYENSRKNKSLFRYIFFICCLVTV